MSGYESLNECIFKINENPIINDRPVNVENLEKFLIFFYLKHFQRQKLKKDKWHPSERIKAGVPELLRW